MKIFLIILDCTTQSSRRHRKSTAHIPKRNNDGHWCWLHLLNHVPRIAVIQFILTFFISAHCYSSAVAAQFEGIIYAEGAYGNEPYKTKMYIKKAKVRLEVEGWKGKRLSVIIYNLESQNMFILTPHQRVFDGPIKPDPEGVAKGKTRKLPPVMRTGKIDKIAGLPVEQYTQTHKDGRVNESWITRSLDFPKDFLEGMIPFVGHLADEEMYSRSDENQWELRKVGRWPDGSIWLFKEVTQVDHVFLQDDLFLAPPEYRKLKHPKGK